MNDILIVKNIEREGSGLLLPILKEQGITYDVIENPADCPSPVGYKAMLVYGGPDSANDNNPKMQMELSRIKEALDHQIPYMGICLGMQTLVKAAAGQVVKADQKEIGFIDPAGSNFSVYLTEDGQKDPLFAELSNKLTVFQLHGETVLLKSDMMLLAEGEYCKVQAVRIGAKAYGIQSHFELTPEMLSLWASEDPDLVPIGQAELIKQFELIKGEYTKTGIQLFNNFLKIAGLIKS